MSGPDDHPDLIAFLRGELRRADVLWIDGHLADCPPCRDELVELATAHAILSSTARTEADAAKPAASTTDRGAAALPPLTVPRGRRLPRTAGIAAAAVVVGLSVGGVLGALLGSDGTGGGTGGDRAPTPYAAATLDPIDADRGAAAGRVEMVAERAARTRVIVVTDDLPRLRGHRFYYAWLLDPATNKMLPLGQIGPGGSATFELDDGLLDSYSAVDVSLEADDGDPAHSVTSVLRGTYDRSRPVGG